MPYSRNPLQPRPILKPFLRWAGGKSLVVSRLLPFVPEHFDHYWEPFAGAAAMFFALAPITATLSDSNPNLIECYTQLARSPRLIYRYLQLHATRSSEAYYYRIRRVYNRLRDRPSAAQAARFIYLNATNFNGIFRVNQNGDFNVPYGWKEPPHIPSQMHLCAASAALREAEIRNASYESLLAEACPKAGDFVYLDPPYPPIGLTSNFRHYTSSRFSLQDQHSVAIVADQLRALGCHVMISNADILEIRRLYRAWRIYRLPVTRWIAANGSRHKANELVITSYEPRNRKHSAEDV